MGKNLVNENEQFTTIKELAFLFKVHPDTIRNIIRKEFPDILQQGKTTYINEVQATRIKEILLENRRLKNLGFKSEVTTNLEKLETIKKGWMYLNEMVKQLQEENENLKQAIEKQKPAIETYNMVMNADGYFEIGELAKALDIKNIGRNNMFKLLREMKILMSNNEPYQRYKNWFKIVFEPYKKGNSTDVYIKTMVKPEGLTPLIKKIKKYLKYNELFE